MLYPQEMTPATVRLSILLHWSKEFTFFQNQQISQISWLTSPSGEGVSLYVCALQAVTGCLQNTPQRTTSTNKLWNSQEVLSQEKIGQGRKIKKEHISVFSPLCWAGWALPDPKGLGQHGFPAWNHGHVDTVFSLVSTLESLCICNPLSTQPSSFNSPLCSLPLCHWLFPPRSPQCVCSLLYCPSSDRGVVCLWMLCHAVQCTCEFWFLGRSLNLSALIRVRVIIHLFISK